MLKICAQWLLGVSLLLVAHPALAGRGGQLTITVTDRDTGQPIACRMHLRNARNVAQKAPKQPYWHDHFVFFGSLTLKLPVGDYNFEIERGPEYLNRTGHFTINDFAEDAHAIDLKRVVDMSKEGWWSGDLNVQRPEKELPLLMDADDLHLAEVINRPSPKAAGAASSSASSAASAPPTDNDPWVKLPDDRWYHRGGQVDNRNGGQLLFCDLQKAVLTSDLKNEHRSAFQLALEARDQPGAWIDVARAFSWDLPMWIAHGMIDSIELANSHQWRTGVQTDEAGGRQRDKQMYPNPTGNARWNATIYYHLLNCGLRMPPSAGSGSGDAPNPVGYNRAYVHVDGEFTVDKWWQGLRAGQVVVSNGPLLRPNVEGELPGHVFQAGAGDEVELEIGLTLSTRETVHYLEIIKDGKVAHSIRLADYVQQGGRLPKLKFSESGWFLIRAVTDAPGTFRFASSGPYYVQVGYQPRISRTSVQFFLDWLNERAAGLKADSKASGSKTGDEAERTAQTKLYDEAREFWEKLLAKANAD
jgi:hypothetical protein